jgi:hypothetical protein
MLSVEIRVKGCLDDDWSEWFEGLEITCGKENETILAGRVADQTALYGLLARLRDLGLELVSVNPSEIEAGEV